MPVRCSSDVCTVCAEWQPNVLQHSSILKWTVDIWDLMSLAQTENILTSVFWQFLIFRVAHSYISSMFLLQFWPVITIQETWSCCIRAAEMNVFLSFKCAECSTFCQCFFTTTSYTPRMMIDTLLFMAFAWLHSTAEQPSQARLMALHSESHIIAARLIIYRCWSSLVMWKQRHENYVIIVE